MKLRIEAVDSPSKSAHEFEDDVIVLGRDAVCDLSLPGVSAVSGRHAQIVLTPEGAFLSDVGSTNGTFINDRRIEGRVKVRPGDYFRLGHTGPSFKITEIDLTRSEPAPRFNPAPEPVVQVAILTEPDGHTAPLPSLARPRSESRSRAESPAPPRPGPPTGPHGQTRMMVMSLQNKNRNLMIFAGAIVIVLFFSGVAASMFFHWKTSRQEAQQREQAALQAQQEEEQRKHAEHLKEQERKLAESVAKQVARPEEVYLRTVGSAVYIVNSYQKGGAHWKSTGSGALIDRERRLVITAYHVVRGNGILRVLSPKFGDGRPLTEMKDYKDTDYVDGRLWASSPELDLAIIELATLPTHITPLKLAEKSPDKNATVHVVGGNPLGSKSLWVSSSGSVKEVVHKRSSFGDGQVIDAWVVRTQAITARGNSGGPLVNDRSELVGIVSSGEDIKAILADKLDIVQDDFIDVRHIKDVLANRPQRTLP